MGETGNISKIAEILANDLFSRFLWQDTGGWNQNWKCVRDDHIIEKRIRKTKSDAGNASSTPSSDEGASDSNASQTAEGTVKVIKILTHPSDVVFYYDEPYSSYRTYVNTDLKSYKKGIYNRLSRHGCHSELSADTGMRRTERGVEGKIRT